jgi:hypothetical protein
MQKLKQSVWPRVLVGVATAAAVVYAFGAPFSHSN